MRWPLDHPLGSAEDVKVLTEWALRSLDEKTLTKVVRACDLWLKAHAQGDLARRLAQLEQQSHHFKSSNPS